MSIIDIDIVEDFLRDTPEMVAEYVPSPFKGLVFVFMVLLCGTLFSASLVLVFALGMLTLPVWVPVAVYNWWRRK